MKTKSASSRNSRNTASARPFGYVYETYCKTTRMYYIGKRSKNKGKFDTTYLGSGIWIGRAIKKYGRKAFTCRPIAWAINRKELNEFEVKYIAKYRKKYGNERMYNISGGGDGWCKGDRHTEATKRIIREKRKLQAPPSEETKKKLSISSSLRTGWHHTEETKKKISIHHLTDPRTIAINRENGRKMGLSHKGKPSHRKGKTLSAETCERMSEGHTGVPLSDHHRQRIQQRVTEWWARRKKLKGALN